MAWKSNLCPWGFYTGLVGQVTPLRRGMNIGSFISFYPYFLPLKML